MQSEKEKKMNKEVDLIQCIKCSHIREKLLVGCPKCGSVDNNPIGSDKDQQGYYIVTLKTIENSRKFYKNELTDEQRTWFSDRIPSGQSWQFYAGIVLSNNLNIIWIRELLDFQQYSEPLSCGNSRAMFVVSFMSKEKQQNFCDFINTFTHERIRDERAKRKEDQTDIQGEDRESI
jgi:hypothetical protein